MVSKEMNYLELIVQVETQRQPYKDSLSFSDSEIAERKTDQSQQLKTMTTPEHPELPIFVQENLPPKSLRTSLSPVNK